MAICYIFVKYHTTDHLKFSNYILKTLNGHPIQNIKLLLETEFSKLKVLGGFAKLKRIFF